MVQRVSEGVCSGAVGDGVGEPRTAVSSCSHSTYIQLFTVKVTYMTRLSFLTRHFAARFSNLPHIFIEPTAPLMHLLTFALVEAALVPRVGRIVLRADGPSTNVADLANSMRDMREAMAKDERSSALMDAMRGTNLNDDDFAAAGTKMQTVAVRGGDDELPTTYSPEALAAYFNRRPGAVLTRLLQVAATAGGWGLKTAISALQGKLVAGSDAEVAAVTGLRGVLVSLGPFYIKVERRRAPAAPSCSSFTLTPTLTPTLISSGRRSLSGQTSCRRRPWCSSSSSATRCRRSSRRLRSRRFATSWAFRTSPRSFRRSRPSPSRPPLSARCVISHHLLACMHLTARARCGRLCRPGA